VIFALSVHDFIDKVGTYVGFAAAIGLALFALLLFSQARELKRLREWGAQAHDRIGELERRLAAALELARRANAPQRAGAVPAQRTGATAPPPARPAPARPALARTSAPTRLPLLPAAAAGVAGPALGSATVFLPLPKQPPGTAPASVAAPAPAPTTGVSAPAAPSTPAAIPAAAASASPAPSAGATPAPATAAAQGPAQPAAPPPPAPAPPPAPPAGANGHSDTFPPVPPVRRPAPPARGGAGRDGRRVPPRGPARPPAGAARRPAAAAAPLRARGAATATPRAPGAGNGSADASHGRRLLLLLAGLGVIAVAAVAAIVLSGGGSDAPSQSSAATSGTPAQHSTGGSGATSTAAPAHDRITVAVLNGTTTAGLASTIASRLTADGFVQGAVTNASDQQRSVTVVSYFGGHEREAREVAQTLNVPSDAVQPIDADTEQACGQGGTCTATVVVTVGADQQ
jgi:LytR cell envelope-related transcriptional attenuator